MFFPAEAVERRDREQADGGRGLRQERTWGCGSRSAGSSPSQGSR